MENTQIYGRAWMFHPSGAKVEMLLPNDPQEAFSYVNELLSAGFLANPPVGTLDRLDVAWVVRCQFTYKNETKTRLYFYKSWGEMGSDMTVYLDTPTDVERFERFSGLTLATMPVFEGDAAPQRNGGMFAKYAVATNFSVTREKEPPSQKYANGRWVLMDYVSTGAPQNAPKQGQLTAAEKAIAWAKSKNYDTSKFPKPTQPHNEDLWRKWCEDVLTENEGKP